MRRIWDVSRCTKPWQRTEGLLFRGEVGESGAPRRHFAERQFQSLKTTQNTCSLTICLLSFLTDSLSTHTLEQGEPLFEILHHLITWTGAHHFIMETCGWCSMRNNIGGFVVSSVSIHFHLFIYGNSQLKSSQGIVSYSIDLFWTNSHPFHSLKAFWFFFL